MEVFRRQKAERTQHPGRRSHFNPVQLEQLAADSRQSRHYDKSVRVEIRDTVEAVEWALVVYIEYAVSAREG